MILAPAGRGRSRGRVSAGAVWGGGGRGMKDFGEELGRESQLEKF